jgi:hypothetical protein
MTKKPEMPDFVLSPWRTTPLYSRLRTEFSRIGPLRSGAVDPQNGFVDRKRSGRQRTEKTQSTTGEEISFAACALRLAQRTVLGRCDVELPFLIRWWQHCLDRKRIPEDRMDEFVISTARPITIGQSRIGR